MAGYRWARPFWPELQRRYWLHECLVYRAPPDQPASAVPSCWRPFDYYHFQTTAFLHERISPQGRRLLVSINMNASSGPYGDPEFDPNPPDRRPVHYLAMGRCAVDTASLVPPNTVAPTDEGAITIGLGQANRAVVFNGQPDPDSPSHFTIGYEMDGKRGTIDGWLTDDKYYPVKLKVRDGPAEEFNP